MDMARTAVNVIGNCLACAVIARWEGELDTSSAPAIVASPSKIYFGGGRDGARCEIVLVCASLWNDYCRAIYGSSLMAWRASLA